jgi:hypothetical protein
VKKPAKPKDDNWISGEEMIAEIRKLLDCSREQAIAIIQSAMDQGLLPPPGVKARPLRHLLRN